MSVEPLVEPKHITPTAPPVEEVQVEQGQGEPEVQGHSCVGTIQVKLAPDDYDTNGDYEALIRTLLPRDAVHYTDLNSNGIYNFPMFGDESLIHNRESPSDILESQDHHVAPVISQKVYLTPEVKGWGMVVLNAGSYDFTDRSHIENMLLSSSMDDALMYRYSEEENGWGMFFTPDNLTVPWSINPIKDIFGKSVARIFAWHRFLPLILLTCCS
jgi:hypothetical protein